MKTLTNYGEQLSTQLDFNLTCRAELHAEHVINLSHIIFTIDVYKLLNKNLNFVPTQKTFDKKTFDKEINDFYDFYRWIKLKAHFKDAANQQHFIEEEIFKKPTSKS